MPVRVKKRSLIYLRRSSEGQEASLEVQLTWALSRVTEMDVEIDATHEDLREMLQRGLTKYKSIRLDDAVSGAVMDRPGLLALVQDATQDKSVSHIFVYRRDRLARPEDAMAMAAMERSVREKGVTIVLSDRIAGPRSRGKSDLGDDLTTLIDYYVSGEFLKQHAERVINGLCKSARAGYWTGGRPPFGFVRVLVDANDNEIEELPPGRIVKQKGCHVRIKPKDESKIQIWLLILDFKRRGWGAKRIANELNARGIPSPDAGRIRKDHGVKHFVSGKWCPGSVLELCRNAAIIGMSAYGRRGEGHHRRLGPLGPRALDERDRTTEDKVKLVNNDQDVVIRAASGTLPQYDIENWQAIQDDLDKRGASQRGIPRAKDPAKYPLSCRVVDLTANCGAFMYGREHGSRRIYVCGRYSSTSGAECENNTVDAEALFGMTLLQIRNRVDQFAGRGKIRERLQEIARRQGFGNDQREKVDELTELEVARKSLEAKIATAGMNYALAETDFERNAAKAALATLEQSMLALSKREERAKASKVIDQPLDVHIDAAMELLSQLSHLASDNSARLEWREMFHALDLRIGLTFAGRIKGRNRAVRTLVGGVIAIGSGQLPVPLYGRNHVSDKSCPPEAEGKTGAADFTVQPTADEQISPLQEVVNQPLCRPEGVSFTMVSRGDWI